MEIANLKVYNDNMRKSLLDKAYFLSFVDSDTFIDFGCADGSLLKYIHEMFPDKKLIGYDISPEMLQVAEKNLEGCNVSLYNNFENVISFPTHLAEFQSIWGNISNNKNLVHFLMKYKWVENWAREVRENYFPITIEEFLSKVPNNYVIDYFYEFIMPQTQQGILKDFNILLKDTTHFKCILRKI